MPKKILYFITELSTGGAQMVLYRLLERFDSIPLRPLVVCLYHGDGAVAQKIRDLGIEVIDLGMTDKWRLDAFWRLFKLLRHENPTILHTWMFHANIPGRIIGKLAGVPLIISSERTMGQEGYTRRLINYSTSFLADRIVCVSRQVADYVVDVIGISPRKLLMIPNGVDTCTFTNHRNLDGRRAHQVPTSAILLGCVARLQPVKGVTYLIEAFSRLAPDHPDLYLLLIGDGPERATLEAQAQHHQLSHRIHFAGDRTDIPHQLHLMDIFVLPSVWEGMPNAALEAMASGLPVVATAVGGSREVIVDEMTGFLVPPAAPEELADALNRLITNADLRQKMGRAGLQRVQEAFTIDRMVDRYRLLYNELLNENLLTTKEN